VIQKRSAIDPDLYEADETGWLDAMCELLDQGRLDELDYSHLREYLADAAWRDRRQVIDSLARRLTSLLVWTHQPSGRTRRLRVKLVRQQQDLRQLCGHGVLRAHAEETLNEAYADAVEVACIATALPPEAFPKDCPYTLDQLLTRDILGDQ
jgi:hypothetical protein